MKRFRLRVLVTLFVLLFQATPVFANAASSPVSLQDLQATYVESNGHTSGIELTWSIASGIFASGDRVVVEKRADGGSWLTVASAPPSTSYFVPASEFESEHFYDLSIAVERDGITGPRNVAVVTGKPSVVGLGESSCFQLANMSKACTSLNGDLQVSSFSEADVVKGECFLTQGKAVCPRYFRTGGVDFSETVYSGDLLYVQNPLGAPIVNVVELSYGCARTEANKIYCWGPGWDFARSINSGRSADIKWPEAVTKFASQGRTVCGLSSSNLLSCRSYDGTIFNGTPNSTLRTKAAQPSSCIESVIAAQICLGSIPNDKKLMDWIGLDPLTATASSFAQVTAGAPPVNTWEKGTPPCYLSSQSGRYACWTYNETILKSTLAGVVRISADGKLAQMSNSEVYRSVQVGNYLRMVPLYSSSRIIVSLPQVDVPNIDFPINQGMAGQQISIVSTPQLGVNHEVNWYIDGEEVANNRATLQLPSDSGAKDLICFIKVSAQGRAPHYIKQELGKIRYSPVISRSVSGQDTLGSPLTASISLANGSLTDTVWRIDGQILAQHTATFVAPYDASGKVVDVTFYVQLGGDILSFESSFQLGTWDVPRISGTGALLQGTELVAFISETAFPYTQSWYYVDSLSRETVLIPGENSSSLFLRDFDSFANEEDIKVRYTFQIPNKGPVFLDYTWEGILERQVLQTDKPALELDGFLEPGGILDCTHEFIDGASYEYTWLRDDDVILGAESSRYMIRDTDVGSQIRCVVFGSKIWHSGYIAGSSFVVPAATPAGTKIVWGSAFLKNYAPNAKVKLVATLKDYGSGFPSFVTYRTKLGTGAWSKPIQVAVPTQSFSFSAVLSKSLLVEVTFADSRGSRRYSQVVNVAPTITAKCSKTVNRKLKLVCAILNPKTVRGVKQGGTLVVDVSTSTWYKGSCGAVARTSNAYTGFGINVGKYTAIGSKEFKLSNGRARVEIPVKFNGEYSWVVSCSMPGYSSVTYDDIFKQTTG